MLAPLLVGIVFLGVYPKPVIERIEPAVDRLVAHVELHSGEPEPVPEIGRTGSFEDVIEAAEHGAEDKHGDEDEDEHGDEDDHGEGE